MVAMGIPSSSTTSWRWGWDSLDAAETTPCWAAPPIQAALCRPATCSAHPESGCVRLLYDCPSIVLLPPGPAVRVIIATHPATDDPPKVGQVRHGLVYELFVSTIAAPALTANDLL